MVPPRIRPIDTRDAKVRARRVSPSMPFIAEVKTIGTPMVFSLPVDNASRTGLLLNTGRNRRVPYRVNTLLELKIDPHGVSFEKPVHCIGKIVRLEPSGDGDRRMLYGVQIVQIESKDAAAWDKVMADLEAAQAKLLPAGDPPAAA